MRFADVHFSEFHFWKEVKTQNVTSINESAKMRFISFPKQFNEDFLNESIHALKEISYLRNLAL